MERIASRQNPVVKRFRDAAARTTPDDVVLLDGVHLVQEALQSRVPIEVLAVVGESYAGLALDAERAGARVIEVTAPVLTAMSPVRQPSGMVAIARRRAATLAECLEQRPQLLLILGGLQDAGNVGAIIRTAEACGATAVICGETTADPFGWKALRGGMGSTFRVRVAVRQPLATVVTALRERRITLVAAVPRGGTPLGAFDLRGPVAILLGAERGLIDGAEGMADALISVPMRPPVESLNVAVTAALVLYEASRQRESR